MEVFVKRLAVLLVLLVIAVPAYPFGQNKIVYDTFKWSVYHSTHFDIYFYEEERPSLQRVVDSAESAYLDYAYTTEGSPITLTAPAEPGAYEIRYRTDRLAGVFATIDITVE